LQVIIERALEHQRTRQRELAARAGIRSAPDPFLGASSAIAALRDNVNRILGNDTPILLLGETGTGKSLLARWIHDHGTRAEEAFVNLNCAGLSREFLESELFGHERGAFTGAVTAKPGLLEVGHRGTVFLDEIGEIDPQVQPKLLKVIEEREFRRLGDVKERRVDIRLIAATHHDLPALVRTNRFREDLYFRINTIAFTVPALRDRTEDIVPIARTILERLNADRGRKFFLSPSSEAALLRYPWPGNIRELRNVLERAAVLSADDEITPKTLHFEPPVTARVEIDTSINLQELERWYVGRILEEVDGNVDRAAARLGIPRSTLYGKLKQYRLGRSKV
jgi:DNA-binding NtrC family response regulator